MSSYLNMSTEQLYKEAEESFGFKVTNITNNPDFGIKIEHVSLGDVPHNKKLALFLSKMLFHFKVVVYPHQNDLLPMQYTEYAKQFAKKDKFSAVFYTKGENGPANTSKQGGVGSNSATPWRYKEGEAQLMVISNIDNKSLGNGLLQWRGLNYERFQLDFSKISDRAIFGLDGEATHKANTMNGAAHYHTDMTFEKEPGSNTMLFCKSIPDDQTRGGQTTFIDMKRAYEELPGDLKAIADNAICGHAKRPTLGMIMVDGDVKLGKDQTRNGQKGEAHGLGVYWNSIDGKPVENLINEAVTYHPLVRPHPVTGEKSLYSPCGTNVGVVGMSNIESFDFLSKIMKHCMQVKYRYDHQYTVGDIVHYDTNLSLHRANPLPSASQPKDTRILLRISNQGVNDNLFGEISTYSEGLHYNVRPDAIVVKSKI